MNKIAIIRSDGKKGYVPINRLQDAITKGGFQIDNEIDQSQEKIPVIKSNGEKGYIRANRVQDAITKGGFQIDNSAIEVPAKSTLLDTAKVFGQGAGKGLTSIASIPKLLGEAAQGYLNYMPEEALFGDPDALLAKRAALNGQVTVADKIPDYGADIRTGLKDSVGLDLEPKPKNAAERIAASTGEFIGGAVSPSGAVKAVSAIKNIPSLLKHGLGTVAQKFGSNVDELGKIGKNAAAIGAGSGVLQETGINPLAADITSSVLMPTAGVAGKNILNAFRNPIETTAKIPLGIMGLSPKRINVQAAEAGRNLGIDLPAAALTDSTLTGLADQWISKTPFFGNRLKNKYATTEQQTLKTLDDIYDSIGASKTPEIEGQIANLYNKAANSLPEKATIKPVNLKKAINNIKIDTAILSPDEKSLLSSLETIKNEIEPTSRLISEFGTIKVPLQEYDVAKLIGTKRSLNSIIKWDTDEGVKNYLRKIQKAINQDIADYGKTNPEWYQNFKQADDLFKNVVRREKVEKLIDKSINPATDKLSYNALAKSINAPENKVFLKKQLDPETFNKIQELGTVAKAMANKMANVPNPSGTATTAATLGVITGLIANPVATLSGTLVPSIIGAEAASRLLTDKKFLDLALKLAKKPNDQLANVAINKRIKDVTGYSAVALNKELQRTENEEGE
jgi:hypothetical protein